jgi:hypothetical protein
MLAFCVRDEYLLQCKTFTRPGVFTQPDLCEGASTKHHLYLVTSCMCMALDDALGGRRTDSIPRQHFRFLRIRRGGAKLRMGDLVTDSFDAAQFDVTLQLLGVCVPKAEVADLSARLRRSGALFNMPRLRSVVECDSDDVRLVLLREDCGEGAHIESRVVCLLCS